MKITSVETFIAGLDRRNYLFVRVQTDEGIHGIGEAYSCGPDEATAAVVADFETWLVGKDPRDIEALWHLMYAGSRFPGGSILNSALSGIEHALWDILGKSLGVPVWRLLGGQVRDKVGVYTHLGLGDMRAVYESLELDPLVERALAVVEKGYKAFKAVFIPYTHYHAPLPDADKVARLMEALRKAVGSSIEIMVDFHGRPASVGAALAYVEALAPGRPMFVEEPLPPGDTAGLKAIAARTAVPLATGERLVERSEFAELLAAGAVSIVQPDICHCGGLSEAKKIAAMAETVGVGVAPHNPLGPIAGVAALHFAVSTPNHVIQEEMVGAVPWYGEVVDGPIRMVDGFWQVPHRPGLGIEVDEAVCARHPFAQEVLHTQNAVTADGTVVDW